jgi:hypothetical protein
VLIKLVTIAKLNASKSAQIAARNLFKGSQMNLGGQMDEFKKRLVKK